jgi:putative membrane protein
MNVIANTTVATVALLHIYFMILEMIFWTRPLGIKTFGLKPDFAQSTKVLAANQGLYNGFLAAGLLWGLLQGQDGQAVKLFFLGCVIIAGIFGAITANTKILYIQALPGFLALVALLIT